MTSISEGISKERQRMVTHFRSSSFVSITPPRLALINFLKCLETLINLSHPLIDNSLRKRGKATVAKTFETIANSIKDALSPV
jgi:predicted GNAT family acetyltransferase